MVTAELPMVELSCKNCRCGATFVVELGSLFENKGRADCPHCLECHYYDLTKAKLLH